MVLRYTARCDADETRCLQCLNILSTAVTHTRANTTYELIYSLRELTLERHATYDTLGYELHDINLALLEVAVCRASLHGVDRAHATVCLELTAVVDDSLAGRLLSTCEHRTYHHAVTARSQCLNDIARVAQATVSDDGHTSLLCLCRSVVDSRELGNTHTCDDACSTDRAWADTHLDAVSTILDEVLCRLSSCDVTNNNIEVRECLLNLAEEVHNTLSVAVCRVENYGVNLLGYECRYAVHSVGSDADACSHAETTLRVLTSVGVVLELCDIAVGDKAYELALVVNNGELLDLVCEEHLCCALKVGLVSSHDVLLSHHLLNLALHVALEAEVAVCYDTDEHALVVNYGDATDLILLHESQGVAHGVILEDSHGVVDHAALGALNATNMRRLCSDRHVLVDNADTALACQGNRQVGLGYGVHSGRHNGDV